MTVMKRLYTTFASPAIAMAALTVLGQPAPTNTQPAVAQDTPAVSIQGSDLKISGLPPVSFHGFASQGFLASDTYNYLGLSKSGSARFMEYGLNASVNPLPRTRITAQGFGYTVGPTGDYEPGLDYALAEYSFCDEIGVRGGRVRRQEGIYNNIVDLDLTRTSILLPQGMYPAEWRDMYSTIDGGEMARVPGQ